MTSNTVVFWEELNKRTINIYKDNNKYYKDYSNVSEDAIIRYGKYYDEFCEKNQFIEYQKKIIELKKIFRENNLSPAEKLMVAYDLVKVKPYKLSNNESLNGLAHEVLFGEYIDCRGYCSLLIELLDSEGIKIVIQILEVYDKQGNQVDMHTRCMVILDDNKYNIHGLFVVSPTEDSYKEEYKIYLGNDLQPKDLYSWFLRPLRDSELYYNETYKYRIMDMSAEDTILNLQETETICDKNPAFILNELIEKKELDKLSKLNKEVFNGLFDGLSKEQISEYINTNYIDLNLMLEIIKSVRRVEGFSEEQILVEIERINRINSAYFPTDKSNKTL